MSRKDTGAAAFAASGPEAQQMQRELTKESFAPLRYLTRAVYTDTLILDFVRDLILAVHTSSAGNSTVSEKQTALLQAAGHIEIANFLFYEQRLQEYQAAQGLEITSATSTPKVASKHKKTPLASAADDTADSEAGKDAAPADVDSIVIEAVDDGAPERPELGNVTIENVREARRHLQRIITEHAKPASTSGSGSAGEDRTADTRRYVNLTNALYKYVPSFEKLFVLAYKVAQEEKAGQKGWFGGKETAFGSAILKLIEGPYNQAKLARHLSQLNDSKGDVQDMLRGLSERILRQTEETDRRLREQAERDERALAERERDRQEAAAREERLARRLDDTTRRLDESMAEFANMSMRFDTTLMGMSFMGGGNTSMSMSFAAPEASLPTPMKKIKENISAERWSCILRVFRAIKQIHQRDTLRNPLLQLMHDLLLPAYVTNDSVATPESDQVVTAWLEKYGATAGHDHQDLMRDLTNYNKYSVRAEDEPVAGLPVFELPEADPDQYYLAVCHGWNKGYAGAQSKPYAQEALQLYQAADRQLKAAAAAKSSTPADRGSPRLLTEGAGAARRAERNGSVDDADDDAAAAATMRNGGEH